MAGKKSKSCSSCKIKVTNANVLKGIRHAEIKGRHKLEKAGPSVMGRNVHAPDLKNKHLKLDEQRMETLDDQQGGSEIDYKKTAENEFMASNPDLRGKNGKRTVKTFRGHSAREFRWDPKTLRPDHVGDVQRGGAFKGGFVNEALKKAYKGYAAPQGHIRKGVGHGGEAIKNVNPFSIKIPIKARDL
tara:strand:+ start:304 stop:864 length:561 start_codon:yes stop_codon:yes gene_type:complete